MCMGEILISSIKFMYRPSYIEIQEKSIYVCVCKVPGKYEKDVYKLAVTLVWDQFCLNFML